MTKMTDAIRVSRNSDSGFSVDGVLDFDSYTMLDDDDVYVSTAYLRRYRETVIRRVANQLEADKFPHAANLVRKQLTPIVKTSVDQLRAERAKLEPRDGRMVKKPRIRR